MPDKNAVFFSGKIRLYFIMALEAQESPLFSAVKTPVVDR